MPAKRKPLTCGSCKHYTPLNETEGNCRRWPLEVKFVGRKSQPPFDPEFVSLYPQSRHEMGACGEYKGA